MRALLAIVLLLAVGTVAVFLWSSGAGAPLPPGGSGSSEPNAASSGSPASIPVSEVPRIRQLPIGVVATHTEPTTIDAEGLADAATACLQVVDHLSNQPLPGAAVRSMHNGADVAFTDEQGRANLPLRDPTQMAVVLDGYLLRLAPVQLGSTEQEPQVVRLVPDRWSLRRRFAFVDPDGKAVSDVFVRLRPQGAPTDGRAPVPGNDDVLRRAWMEHTMLAARPASHDVAVQLGSYSADRVHHLEGPTPTVRFLVPGTFVLEAATTTGLVARVEVAVITGSEPPAQLVSMTAGASIAGRVTDLAGGGLEAAEISVQGSEPLGLVATTAADGTFALGPLALVPVTLLVRHGTHEPVAHGPVSVPTQDLLIQLTPLKRTPLRGRVRSRPGLQPIADANVIWQVAGGAAITAKTKADGTFELQAAGDIASKLLVQAPGYVSYAELVDPNAAFADYDIWPADRATRVAKGITATLEGVVFGSNGSAMPNVSVRWTPDAPSNHVGMPGRRVLEGAVLQLPGVATTDSSGAFVIETNQFGRGSVALAADPGKLVPTTAIAGQSKQGLELHQ